MCEKCHVQKVPWQHISYLQMRINCHIWKIVVSKQIIGNILVTCSYGLTGGLINRSEEFCQQNVNFLIKYRYTKEQSYLNSKIISITTGISDYQGL